MRRSRNDRTGSIDRDTRARRPAAGRRGISQAGPNVDEAKKGRVLNDWSGSSFECQSALLGDARMSHPANAGLKSEMARSIQRTFGNKYVQRLVKSVVEKRNALVQTKLIVGPAGDKYEQEADSVAVQVVKGLVAEKPSPVQKQEDEVGQAKLQRQEEEEMIMPKLQRQDDLDDDLQMKLQRQDDLDDDLQMAPDEGGIGLEGGSLDQGTESLIEGARSGGSPLPDRLRASMESAFGADFSGVRVHSDGKSDELNDKLTSRAFTTGQDIFLKKGEYKPDSLGGKELLAHELTHVVQQKGEEVQHN